MAHIPLLQDFSLRDRARGNTALRSEVYMPITWSMASRGSYSDEGKWPACPVCHPPIKPTDPVGMANGRVLHFKCWIRKRQGAPTGEIWMKFALLLRKNW